MPKDKNWWWLYLIVGLVMNMGLTRGLAEIGYLIMALALYMFLVSAMPKTFDGVKILLVVVAMRIFGYVIGLLSGDIGAS